MRGQTGGKVRCEGCGARHIKRDKRPGWCLTCDLRDRHQAGYSVEGIAEYADLPAWLVEAVL